MASNRDYYEILGVDRNADQRTIKRAFLKLARTLHPDVNKEPDAEERFKAVNEAYSVLSDERKRANYDQFGNPDGPGGFGSEYVDMSDIFGGGFGGISDIFDSFFGGGGGSARAARTRGRDMGIALRISLAEAAAGCSKTIAYDRLAPCDDCGGSGVAEGGKEKTCDRCHGTGRVTEVQRTVFGPMQSQMTCPACHGSGRVVENPCETCQGEGRTPSHETVRVDIPAGIHSGQSIRVAGRGEAGVRGDESGDLVVTIQIAEDERFERQGDDLYAVRDIDAIDAMLGTTVHIDGILADEHVDVEIPAGCQHGQQIVVDAKGMPRLGTSGRGRLVLVANLIVPTNLSEDDKAALRDIRERRDGLGGAAEAHHSEEAQGASANESSNARKEKAKRRRSPFRGKRW